MTEPLDLPAPARDVARGSVLVFFGEALVVPTGLLLVAYLTRRLGAAGYGLFALTLALVVWIEWTLASLFGRVTIRLISEAADWRPVATRLLWAQTGTGLAAAAGVWLLASAAAAAMDTPPLAADLRLIAIEPPLFCAALVHWNVAVGRGRFRQRAIGSAVRWVSRLVLVVGCTQLSVSPRAALIGIIAASAVELAVARRLAPIPLTTGAPRTGALVAWSMWPIWTSGVLTRAFERLDLLMLKGLGGSVEQAGVYAAAQSLCLLPALVATAVAPQWLAALTRMRTLERSDEARVLAVRALRTAVWLLPVAGAVAGASADIVAWLFGPAYGDAAPLLARLIVAATAQVVIAVSGVIFVAADRLRPLVWLATMVLVGAAAGHLLAIPRWGGMGAATVTLIVSTVGAAAALVMLRATVGVALPWKPLVQALGSAGIVALAGAVWPVPVWLAPVKCAVLAAVTLGLIGAMEGFARVGGWVRQIVEWKKGTGAFFQWLRTPERR